MGLRGFIGFLGFLGLIGFIDKTADRLQLLGFRGLLCNVQGRWHVLGSPSITKASLELRG